MKPKTVQVKLEGESLELVLSEQDKYRKKDMMMGKAIIVNRLLCELYKLKNKSK